MATHSREKRKAIRLSTAGLGLGRETTMLRLGDYELPGVQGQESILRTMYIRLDQDKLAELAARAMRSTKGRVAMAGGAITMIACAKDNACHVQPDPT